MIGDAVADAFSLVWAIALSALLLDAGCRAARSLGVGGPASLRLLAGVVLGVSGLWSWMLALAAVGALGPRSAAVGIVAAFAALRARDPAPGAVPVARIVALLAGRARRQRAERIAAWWLGATLLLVTLDGLRQPVFDYDSLSYHLPFTARVLDSGTIPHLDTPFGDPAAAYQPKSEHVLRSLLAPVPGHERLVWTGALPHLPLLWLAVYVAARSLGAPRAACLWGVSSTLLATVTLSQAQDALVDLPVASWWMAFAACALARPRKPGPSSLPLIAGLALGLAFGSKYLAVALAPLLPLVLVPASWRAPRARDAALLCAGTLVTGGFFYLRNAWWTGNPAYPVRVEILGWPLLDGPIARGDMLDWIFNASRAHAAPLLERLAAFVGPLVGNARVYDLPDPVTTICLLSIVPVGLWLAGSLEARRRLNAAGAAAIAPATLALGWLAVPFTYGRFMILATGSVGTMTALAARRWPRTTVAAVAGGAIAQYALVGDRWHALVVTALGIAVGRGLVMEGSVRRDGRRHPMTPAVAAGLLLALGIGVTAATHPAVLDAAPRSWRPGLRWIDALPPDARIAYAGNNVPYLLRGPGRSVLHIPPDGDLAARFDTRAARWARADGPAAISPSPGFDRGVQDATAWLDALRAVRIDVLVVTPLSGPQLVQVRHDDRAMPIEDHWARAAAPALEAVYLDEVFHTYSLHPEREPASPLPASRERREPDAFALLSHPRALARHYPLGVTELALPQYDRVRRRVRQMTRQGRAPDPGD